MAVLTDEKSTHDSTMIVNQNIPWCCPRIVHHLAICVSLYAIISSMLLPLTVRGRIGGQYGVLIEPESPEQVHREVKELLALTDLPLAVELGLTILISLVHFAGFITVLKKSTIGMLGYLIYRLFEITMYLYWFASIGDNYIKSHTMSQFSLGWYCFFGFAMSIMSFFVHFGAILKYAHEDYKSEKGYDA